MPLLTSVLCIINTQWAQNTGKNYPADSKRYSFHDARFGLRSFGATKWNDHAEVVELLKVWSYSTHCCYSGDSSAAIFTIPIIPRAADNTAFPISSDSVPTCILSCKAPRSPAQPRIYFLINTPLWASAPCLEVIYLSMMPSLRFIHLLLLWSFLSIQAYEKREFDTQAINYLLGLSPDPKPKPPTSPPLWILSWGKKKNPRGGGNSTCFSCFVISDNAFFPWVALWVVAWPVRITYFIQLGKIRVGGLKRITEETLNGTEEELRWKWKCYRTERNISYQISRCSTISKALVALSQDLLLFYLVGPCDFLEFSIFLGIPEQWRGNRSRALIRQVCIISKGKFQMMSG